MNTDSQSGIRHTTWSEQPSSASDNNEVRNSTASFSIKKSDEAEEAVSNNPISSSPKAHRLFDDLSFFDDVDSKMKENMNDNLVKYALDQVVMVHQTLEINETLRLNRFCNRALI